jgi:hypothetical protein
MSALLLNFTKVYYVKSWTQILNSLKKSNPKSNIADFEPSRSALDDDDDDDEKMKIELIHIQLFLKTLGQCRKK